MQINTTHNVRFGGWLKDRKARKAEEKVQREAARQNNQAFSKALEGFYYAAHMQNKPLVTDYSVTQPSFRSPGYRRHEAQLRFGPDVYSTMVSQFGDNSHQLEITGPAGKLIARLVETTIYLHGIALPHQELEQATLTLNNGETHHWVNYPNMHPGNERPAKELVSRLVKEVTQKSTE